MAWLLIEEPDCVIVVPESDIAPHGYPLGKRGALAGQAKLAGLNCPCKPHVTFGNGEVIYEKPMLIHNSFEDERRITQSMERPTISV